LPFRLAHGLELFDPLILFKKLFGISAQESPANAKGMHDSSACMKAHCEQM